MMSKASKKLAAVMKYLSRGGNEAVVKGEIEMLKVEIGIEENRKAGRIGLKISRKIREGLEVL